MELFLDEAFSKSARNNKIICPCKKCCNRYFNDRVTVGGHLLWYGMDPLYMAARWTHHGETYLDESNVEGETNVDLVNNTPIDSDMYDFLSETFVQSTQSVGSSSMHHSTFEDQTPEAERFYKLLDEANKPLYPGSKYKKLDAVVKLYQIKCLGNVRNSTFSLFLELFKDMLPEDNCLPKSNAQAKKIIDELGLTYEKIDACVNDCMLYWKETSNLDSCSRCGVSRYKNIEDKSDGKKVSAKVLRYFPLTPRLKRLYLSHHTAEHMRWHSTSSSTDGFMRHPADSPAWKHLDLMYPDFAFEIRNVRLGLASDGFNPFAHMNSKHSTWPVIISIYNLPPWLCMKQPYLFMSLLIPGPHEPGKDIDVYMQPLVDELKQLWEVGTSTYDVFTKQTFNMRAAVLWTINDFPAYANLSGWSTSGKLACPHCNYHTCSVRLPNSKKQAYLGSRNFLPITHRFRFDVRSFNGKREDDVAPKPLTGIECLIQLSNLKFTFGKAPIVEPTTGKRRRNINSTREPRVIGPWKKKSIFFTLPYWQNLLIRHNIDVMHLEKNVSENILGTVIGTSKKGKDGIQARADLEILNIRKSLQPIREGNRTYIPPAIFFTTSEEKILFCKVFSDIRVPDGYSANIARCIDMKEKKLTGLKSHDHHVIMQHLLPLAIRRVLPRPLILVLLELSTIFRLLCSKKQHASSMSHLKYRITLALCMMEKMFPPSFFTISVHLIIHLADEAALAGPVHYRWMYPIERYLQSLKRYVRNKSNPEGSIAVGYLAEECVSFCSMYLTGVETRHTRHGRNADISLPRNVEGGLSIFANSGHHLGKRTEINLEKSIWEQCHTCILFNCSEVAFFLDKRLRELRKVHQRKTIRELESLRNKEFSTWFRHHVNNLSVAENSSISKDLLRLANGPSMTVTDYKKYVINGYRFRTKSVDDRYKNQNCGVFVNAETSSYSSVRDCSPITGNVDYYGVLKNIYELDYRFPGESDEQACKVVLFECDWVNNSGKKKDIYGFNLVNFNRVAQNKDRFILASQAIQVFYVVDPKEPDWSVAIKTKPRDFYDLMEENDAIDIDDYYATSNLDDPKLDDEELQIRTDVRGVYVNKVLPMSVVDASTLEEDVSTEEENESECDDEI